ncbi:SpaA isopeptide-forming pilin-related protein [Senegalia sp. (in: firmicutes)]|uniref:SpaA isopeptide-forming pilin-related protein n=1 Tax=Senegalia sp. (in: firmicutes) TaxID=1924098 RepID=UPI003F99D0B8
MKHLNGKKILAILLVLMLILPMGNFLSPVIVSADENMETSSEKENSNDNQEDNNDTNMNDENQLSREQEESKEGDSLNDTYPVKKEENKKETNSEKTRSKEESPEETDSVKKKGDTEEINSEKIELKKENKEKNDENKEEKEKPIEINKLNENQSNDKKEGSIKVIKKVDKLDTLLAGAKFELRDGYGNVLRTETTDANGEIIFNNLPFGSYEVQEIEAPEGYVKYNPTYLPRLNESNPNSVVNVKNYRKDNIVVTKKDADTDDLLQGAKFTLKDEDGNLIDTLTTNVDGRAVFSNLIKGMYYLEEIEAPEGYELNDIEYEIEASYSGYDIQMTIENSKKKLGSITINKVDGDTGEVLPGAEFELKDSNGDVIDTLLTDQNGKAKKENLPKGKYTLYETAAPQGYIIYWQDREYDVEITEDNLDIVQEVKNYKTGTITITKVDGDTGEPLSGVDFSIHHEVNGNTYRTVKTDENGKLNLRSLRKGKYTLKEYTVPEGYERNNNEYEFEIGDGNWNIKKTIENFKAKEGSLVINKVDGDTGEAMEAEFEMYYMLEGEKVKAEGTFMTVNGILEIPKMPFNTYYIKEIKATEGYKLADEIEIVIDSEETIEKTIKNYMRGSISIKKIDGDTKEPLSGVEFELRGSDLIKILVTDKNGEVSLSDLPRGEYTLEEIKSIEGYKVDDTKHRLEIKVEGLDIEKTIKNFKKDLVEPKGEIVINKVDGDTQKSLDAEFELYYMDGEDKIVVGDQTYTTTNGKLQFSELSFRTYHLKEVKAPEGYKLIDDIKIVVDTEEVIEKIVKNYKDSSILDSNESKDGNEAEENNELEVNDKPEKPDKDGYLPQTGEKGNLLYYIIGSFIILIGIFLFRKKHVNN